MAGRKSGADWAAIEAAYREGRLTIAEIARQFGVTEGAIHKRSKRNGWTRAKPAEEIREEAIKGQLIVLAPTIDAGAAGDGPDADNLARVPESATDAILTHREAIARARSLAARMTIELEEQTTKAGLIDHLIEHAFAGGGLNGVAIRERLRNFLEVGSRSKVLLNLTKSLADLVQLERQAFGLEEKAVEDPIVQHRLAMERQSASGRSKEEVARAILDLVERASREKQKATMQ